MFSFVINRLHRQKGVAMTTVDTSAATMLHHLMEGEPLGLPGQIRVAGSDELLALGIDNGNGHTKSAVFSPDGALCTVTIPTVYRSAREIRGGTGITRFTVNAGGAFWIGADALAYDGDALPIGATAERVADQRHRDFLAAVIVESLLAAGYAPGIHNLAVGFAIPNDEIVLKQKDNRLGVAKETREALRQTMYGKTFTVVRTDTHGQATEWVLTYSVIAPQAQSLGTYLIWKNAPNGLPVDNGIEALTIIDVGTGDLQRTDIDVNPYRLMGEKLGRGTINMARQFAQRLPQLRLNDAQATNAMITRSLRIDGRRVDVGPQVDAIIAAEGQDLVARMLPVLQQNSRFVLFTGGGVLLDGLRAAIEERAQAAGKAKGQSYAIVPQAHAISLNAIGALVAVVQSAVGSAA
jgi:hypothetical protein